MALLLFLERVGRALPKFQSKRPALPRVFSHQAHRNDGQDTTKTSIVVSTCSKGSTSAQGPAADDGKRKTSDSDPSSDNHPPTGTRHDNASIPRLRRRPPSSARTLRGRHGQALHLRGRLRPHGPRSRRRPHALLGLAPRESPVRILEGRRARGLVRADGHGRAHPDRLGHLLRHDEGLGRRRRARLPRRDAPPHRPRLHGLRAPRL